MKTQHWQVPLSKRFRALKLWFVIRSYGIKGLQKHVRESVRLAQKMEALILGDARFEIAAPRHLGLVVFRLKGDNELTEKLLKTLNARGKIHCVPAALKGKYVIRFTVTSQRTTLEDITSDWAEIRGVASAILMDKQYRTRVSLAETKEKNPTFGSSLLLSNSPMSPKIVNGSFAAIFDNGIDLLSTVRLDVKDSPAVRRRIRGMLMSGKQFSLDSRMDLVQSLVVSSGIAGSTLPSTVEESGEPDAVPPAGRQTRSKSVDHSRDHQEDKTSRREHCRLDV